MSIMTRLSVVCEDIQDFIIASVVGSPEETDERMNQGVRSVTSDDQKKRSLIRELSEIYFSFVLTRLGILDDFKKEGKTAYARVANLGIYREFTNGGKCSVTEKDISNYKKNLIFAQIIEAIGARYNYFGLVQKNRLLTYELLNQYRIPLESCSFPSKRHGSIPLTLGSFFKHDDKFIFSEVVPVISGSFEEMCVVHSDWISRKLSDYSVKAYYNERTCEGIFTIIRDYWLDTTSKWEYYGINEGAFSVTNRTIKNDEYERIASEESEKILNEQLPSLEDALNGRKIDSRYHCRRPSYINILDDGLILWAVDKMNEFGLFTDKNGQLLEPDIFDRKYVPEFYEIDLFLSAIRDLYDTFHHRIVMNTNIHDYSELSDHCKKIYGNSIKIHRKRGEYGPVKLSGGDLPIDREKGFCSISDVFDMYLWKNHRDYYCGFINDTFRYLCLPLDKQRFLDPKHSSVYKPELSKYAFDE